MAHAGGQFHVLVIVADGQVSEGIHTQETIGERDPRATPHSRNPDSAVPPCLADAIVAASHFPLAIVLIGVGDGPWEEAKAMDDLIPQRRFDK